MRVAIMQPTYLPWVGYFDLIDSVDAFVLLDTVQFDKRSWQQRNQLKGQNGLQMLTVPVKSAGRFDQKICDVELADGDFSTKHLQTIRHLYIHAPHFPEYFEEFSTALRSHAASGKLSQLTSGLIIWLAARIGINTPVLLASNLHAKGKRSELLAAICREIGADTYVTPPGAGAYLVQERSCFAPGKIRVVVQQYEPSPYAQLHGPFVPYASILDVLMNRGPECLNVIRSGRGSELDLDDWEQQDQMRLVEDAV